MEELLPYYERELAFLRRYSRDFAERTLIAPTQLPVGVITTLLGVPTFLYLLMRSTR